MYELIYLSYFGGDFDFFCVFVQYGVITVIVVCSQSNVLWKSFIWKCTSDFRLWHSEKF